MWTIEKGPEPPSLRRHRKRGGTWENYPQRDDTAGALLRDQGHLCCFCMRRISLRAMKVAHWASQSDHDDMTVDWNNLMGACKGGDGERGAIKHCDTAQGNTPIKVNPLDRTQRCERLIRYRADGEMSSADAKIRHDLEVTLNLNNENLQPKRAQVYDILIRRLGSEEQDYWPRDLIAREIEVWRRRDREGMHREFCQVAIYFLEKWLRRKG